MFFYSSFRNQDEAGAEGLRVPYGDGVTDYTATERAPLLTARSNLDATLRSVLPSSFYNGALGYGLFPTTRSGGNQLLELRQDPSLVFPNRPEVPPGTTLVDTYSVPESIFDTYRAAGTVVHDRLVAGMNAWIGNNDAPRASLSPYEYRNMAFSMRTNQSETFFGWRTGYVHQLIPLVTLVPTAPNRANIEFSWYGSPPANPAGTMQVRFRAYRLIDSTAFPIGLLPNDAAWFDVGNITFNAPTTPGQQFTALNVDVPAPTGNAGTRAFYYLVGEVRVNSTLVGVVEPDVMTYGFPNIVID